MHDCRDRDAVLNVAVMIQRLNQPGEIGNDRVMEPVDFSVDAVDELCQVCSRCARYGSQNEPTDQERDRLAFSIRKLTAFVGDTARCRGLISEATNRAREYTRDEVLLGFGHFALIAFRKAIFPSSACWFKTFRFMSGFCSLCGSGTRGLPLQDCSRQTRCWMRQPWSVRTSSSSYQ